MAKVKVYLDNNIIVGIENGDYELSSFKSLCDVEYFYSAAHIEELIEGENIPLLSIDKRLTIIDEIFGSNHIISGSHEPEIFPKYVREMYNLLRSPKQSIIRKMINSSLVVFNPDRDRFLKILRLKRVEVNNIKPCDIITEIDTRLLTAEDSLERISVREYLSRTYANGRAVYCTLFNLLDFACFYKDKPNDHSNIARMHDASHAYYAQLCDVFVSDDKRMRYKTEAVYSYLGVCTKVMSGKEFLESMN